MTYLPIARKYRPQKFSEVVGQDVAVRTLENAIRLTRIHHAYLFCGIRGVGKTSIARILAKSLNCERGPTLDPCGECPACREISQGISLDVLEIDGASNTGVDDIRDIKEQVAYLPQQGKYKIYIIDEVHMLSTSAFNALLKVLEEPPAHVIFCFATTETHKIPLTILSRCQRIALRRIPFDAIVTQLATICKAEAVTCDSASLVRIARLGDGSMRDSISLLDQAIGMSQGQVTREFLDDWLGFTQRELLYALLTAVLKRETAPLLDGLRNVETTSESPDRFLIEYLELVRHLILIKAGATANAMPDVTAQEYADLAELAPMASAEEWDWMFQMGNRGLQDLAQSPLPFYTLEILFLRFLRIHDLGQALGQGPSRQEAPPQAPPPKRPPAPMPSAPKPIAAPPPAAAVPSSTATVAAPPAAGSLTWQTFVQKMRTEEAHLGSLLAHVKWRWVGDDTLDLVAGEQKFYRDMLLGKKARLEELASAFFARPIIVTMCDTAKSAPTTGAVVMDSIVEEERKVAEVRHHTALKEAHANPIIKTLTEIFGATVEEVKPL